MLLAIGEEVRSAEDNLAEAELALSSSIVVLRVVAAAVAEVAVVAVARVEGSGGRGGTLLTPGSAGAAVSAVALAASMAACAADSLAASFSSRTARRASLASAASFFSALINLSNLVRHSIVWPAFFEAQSLQPGVGSYLIKRSTVIFHLNSRSLGGLISGTTSQNGSSLHEVSGNTSWPAVF